MCCLECVYICSRGPVPVISLLQQTGPAEAEQHVYVESVTCLGYSNTRNAQTLEVPVH